MSHRHGYTVTLSLHALQLDKGITERIFKKISVDVDDDDDQYI